MKISAIDDKNNLFSVEDFYSAELIQEFLATDHLLTPFEKGDMQEQYPRRSLIVAPGSIYAKMNDYVNINLPNISECIGLDIVQSSTGFWLDEENFSMTPHLDNENVVVAIQIYLNYNDSNLGTTFFNEDKRTVRFKPQYQLNCGYIMINDFKTQYHGAIKPVPRGTYRISSYSWLHKKV